MGARKENTNFDVIILGGSYAGLSAAMALGRALRTVLVIDGGMPCNRQTPHSHNFITQDGEKPAVIAEKAKAQVLRYSTVTFRTDVAIRGQQTDQGFTIDTQSGATFAGRKLIFATGVKDIMPAIDGFSACWGISVIHCPYCHGYEVKHQKTGVFANGDAAMQYAQLLRNWTEDLTVFTNGPSTLTSQQVATLTEHRIPVVEKTIDRLKHERGYIEQLVFKDGSTFALSALYARPDFEQHCPLPEALGCALTEQGHIKVDMGQKTTVAGIFACGDNASGMRSVANAVAAGNLAGAMVNHALCEEAF
ncbi:NAD(P)/FAD-dependent oxidoreductase [Parapedobacter sp. DT-150]|uniref:NAD(P)/FAD-dependent oxidoreductase n=1 Tax=Parapedobacter sp. DT-150 TaxID=3396162 RepID=UPI003F1BEBDF